MVDKNAPHRRVMEVLQQDEYERQTTSPSQRWLWDQTYKHRTLAAILAGVAWGSGLLGTLLWAWVWMMTGS